MFAKDLKTSKNVAIRLKTFKKGVEMLQNYSQNLQKN